MDNRFADFEKNLSSALGVINSNIDLFNNKFGVFDLSKCDVVFSSSFTSSSSRNLSSYVENLSSGEFISVGIYVNSLVDNMISYYGTNLSRFKDSLTCGSNGDFYVFGSDGSFNVLSSNGSCDVYPDNVYIVLKV